MVFFSTHQNPGFHTICEIHATPVPATSIHRSSRPSPLFRTSVFRNYLLRQNRRIDPSSTSAFLFPSGKRSSTFGCGGMVPLFEPRPPPTPLLDKSWYRRARSLLRGSSLLFLEVNFFNYSGSFDPRPSPLGTDYLSYLFLRLASSFHFSPPCHLTGGVRRICSASAHMPLPSRDHC